MPLDRLAYVLTRDTNNIRFTIAQGNDRDMVKKGLLAQVKVCYPEVKSSLPFYYTRKDLREVALAKEMLLLSSIGYAL
jgi:hypothetical protein